MGNYMKQIIEHEYNGKMYYSYWEGDKEYPLNKEEADAEVAADPENVEIKPFAESIVGLAKAANEYVGLRSTAYLEEKSLGEQFGMIYDILKTVAPESEWIKWQDAIKKEYPKS